MSYNHKNAQITNREKALRDHKVDPKADDNQTIWEKELPHREGVKETITEDQMTTNAQTNKDDEILEKILNDAKSYVQHRSDAAEISVPPINAVVEKKTQERMEDDWKTDKKSHWSITFNDQKQRGSLPKWPKNAPQHDKIVLNNDPRRFEGATSLPTNETQSKNDATHGQKPNIKPLVGNITQAEIKTVAEIIKQGSSVEYDSAMVAILSDAEREERELSTVERKAISDLKVARTKAMLKLIK